MELALVAVAVVIVGGGIYAWRRKAVAAEEKARLERARLQQIEAEREKQELRRRTEEQNRRLAQEKKDSEEHEAAWKTVKNGWVDRQRFWDADDRTLSWEILPEGDWFTSQFQEMTLDDLRRIIQDPRFQRSLFKVRFRELAAGLDDVLSDPIGVVELHDPRFSFRTSPNGFRLKRRDGKGGHFDVDVVITLQREVSSMSARDKFTYQVLVMLGQLGIINSDVYADTLAPLLWNDGHGSIGVTGDWSRFGDIIQEAAPDEAANWYAHEQLGNSAESSRTALLGIIRQVRNSAGGTPLEGWIMEKVQALQASV